MALRRYDLPLQADGSSRFLPWFIGLMVYLATLTLAFSLVLTAAIERWDAGLQGSLTVQIPVPADGSALAPDRVDRMLSLLRQTPGIAAATPMSAAAEQELLRPWLGDGFDAAALPLPILVDIHTDSGVAIDVATLEQRLGAIVPGTSVATHDRWLGRLFRTARLIVLSGDLAVALIGAGAVLTIIFTTRTGLLIHHDVIELLHLVGAQDSYVARQFQSHAFRQALRGGAVGMVLAVLTIGGVAAAAAFGHGGDEATAFQGFGISLLGWAALLLMPVAAGGVALLTARITVLRILGRMP